MDRQQTADDMVEKILDDPSATSAQHAVGVEKLKGICYSHLAKSQSSLSLVREFHQTFRHPVNDEPTLYDPVVNRFRYELIKEENEELADALGVPFRWWEIFLSWFGWQKGQSKFGVLDALTDLQYVLDGAYLSLGYWRWKNKAVAEVHRSNMSKAGADGLPILREDGKVLKGPNYSPPKLIPVLLGEPDNDPSL